MHFVICIRNRPKRKEKKNALSSRREKNIFSRSPQGKIIVKNLFRFWRTKKRWRKKKDFVEFHLRRSKTTRCIRRIRNRNFCSIQSAQKFVWGVLYDDKWKFRWNFLGKQRTIDTNIDQTETSFDQWEKHVDSSTLGSKITFVERSNGGQTKRVDCPSNSCRYR